MISDFGNFLLKISSTVPHGVLVVFSSYAVLSDTRMQLIDSKVWEKINLNKEIMSEPK
jgi:Rad3-related DNA helicase